MDAKPSQHFQEEIKKEKNQSVSQSRSNDIGSEERR